MERNKRTLNKYGTPKSVRKCKDKLRYLKDQYKKANDNNKKSGAAPEFPPYYEDFDEMLGC